MRGLLLRDAGSCLRGGRAELYRIRDKFASVGSPAWMKMRSSGFRFFDRCEEVSRWNILVEIS